MVICGPSGSGKSTLAFDIVYAEGQRRYVESLSAYARQFLPQLDKPDVEKIEGLSPAISLEQHSSTRNPRSTVGTVTELYDFLRVFFARLGTPQCPQCGRDIQAQTSDQILDSILQLPADTKCMLLAPLVEHKKGSQKDILQRLKSQGFVRVRVDGLVLPLDPFPVLEKNSRHSLEVVVDRLVLRDGIHKRLADSLELTLNIGQGRIIVALLDGQDVFYSTEAVCPKCSISLPQPTPQLFSFNSPQGACPLCSGLGKVEYFEPVLLAPNKGLSLEQGGIIPLKKGKILSRHQDVLKRLGEKWEFDLTTPLKDLSSQAWERLFYGDPETGWQGVIPLVQSGMEFGQFWHQEMSRFKQSQPCPQCQGARLRPEALAYTIHNITLYDVCSWSVSKTMEWISQLAFQGAQAEIAGPIIKEVLSRLTFLVNVGLGYLSLHRDMATLSGGEAQRIRLAGQLGSGLVGVTYVLDEPSIGLHPKDNSRLIKSLQQLRERGNTVLVVEHDEATIRSSEYIIELGPGSGALGGEVVFSGCVSDLVSTSNSLTGKYLRGELSIPPPKNRRTSQEVLSVLDVQTNNLKNLDFHVPLGTFVCVTGVSGSGKSSLVVDTVYKHLALSKGIKVNGPGVLDAIQGVEKIDKIISIDQTPIGRTPRSNPATYTKVFDEIRTIFAATPEARKRGFKPGRFSFNVRGGRCEACQGEGQLQVEMHFLPDVYVTCDVCQGKRYNRETLDVTYKGLNISQVLGLSVRQAKKFFQNYQALERKLAVLEQVGLEYLTLGQPATTLSGGEAQRLKISRELGKKSLPRSMYILDEPTTGLHMHEVGKLIQVLQELVDKGATVIVIEHNLDIIKAADYVYDLGPGGGEDGGRIVAQGTPEEIRDNTDSVTGVFLRTSQHASFRST